jgi:hypothetical protein
MLGRGALFVKAPRRSSPRLPRLPRLPRPDSQYLSLWTKERPDADRPSSSRSLTERTTEEVRSRDDRALDRSLPPSVCSAAEHVAAGPKGQLPQRECRPRRTGIQHLEGLVAWVIPRAGQLGGRTRCVGGISPVRTGGRDGRLKALGRCGCSRGERVLRVLIGMGRGGSDLVADHRDQVSKTVYRGLRRMLCVCVRGHSSGSGAASRCRGLVILGGRHSLHAAHGDAK